MLAFGQAHVPIQPGSTSKTVRMFQSVAPSNKEFFGSFTPGPAHSIEDPKLVAKAAGREVARVKAGGSITIDISVTERNMTRHGYICDAELK